MKQKEEEKISVKEIILKDIENGMPYVQIAKNTGADLSYIKRVGSKITFEEPTEEIKQAILERYHKRIPMIQIQQELKLPRELVKFVIQEAENEKVEEINEQLKKEEKEKNNIEQLVGKMIQNPEFFKKIYSQLKEESQKGKLKRVKVISAVCLEKGALFQAEKLIKLGIQEMGREKATEFVKMEEKILGYKLCLQWNQCKDWEKVAINAGIKVAKAKELASRVNLEDIMPKEEKQEESEENER